VPAGALYTAVSLVKPVTLLTLGRLDQGRPALVSRLKGAGLRGLSIACPPVQSDVEFTAWATATLRRARRVAGSVIVYGVSERHAAELSALGASHVSLRLG
jgi:hypothetical protein